MAVPPGRHRRRASPAVRRRRALVAVVGLVVLAALGVGLALRGGGSPTADQANGAHTANPPTNHTTTGSSAAPAIRATAASWSLAAPLSREVVLPGGSNHLVVAGGLLASQASSTQVERVDTASGAATPLTALPDPVHDAPGSLIGGRAYLYGGGSPDTVATVQRFGIPALGSNSPPAVASQLPQPRSDAATTTIGTTTYIVGGYDGTAPDPVVLATTDGQRFSPVANLAVPVRYPAVAALGGRIYIFGGEAVGGPSDGQAVDDIQEVDPAKRSATLIGHLPHPLAGASALNLGGRIYIFGGVTDTASAAATTTIWAFDPGAVTVSSAGTLPVATSYAGAAVVRGRAWLVGGENTGTPMASVQVLAPAAGTGHG